MISQKDRIDRYERGITQKEIVRFVMQFKNGVEEPKIREHLKTEFGITSPKGIKIHLEKLESLDILIKNEQRGGANIWGINYPAITGVNSKESEYLITNFLVGQEKSPENMKLLISTYNSEGFQLILQKLDYVLLLINYFQEVFSDQFTNDNSLRITDIKTEPRNFKLFSLIKEVASISPTFLCELLTKEGFLLPFSIMIKNRLLSMMSENGNPSNINNNIRSISSIEIWAISIAIAAFTIDYFKYLKHTDQSYKIYHYLENQIESLLKDNYEISYDFKEFTDSYDHNICVLAAYFSKTNPLCIASSDLLHPNK